MAKNVSCPGYRIRSNGVYTHICDNCSSASRDVNFGLMYQGDKQIWRDGVLARANHEIAEARARGLDPGRVS
ncbi:hypothetical protein EBZ38_09640 [bacterium]|nr:hypothetical protein [bacterium]NDD84516.1 hypothetical protein [bacterium]